MGSDAVFFTFFLGCCTEKPPENGEVKQGEVAEARKDPPPGHRPNPRSKDLPPHRAVVPTEVALSPDGKQLLLGYNVVNDNELLDYLKLWDVQTGKEIRTLRGPMGKITFIRFLPDGKRALAGSDDGSLHLYSTTSGKLLRQIKAYPKYLAAAMSTDGQFVLTSAFDHGKTDLLTLKLWRIETGDLVSAIDIPNEGFLAVSPDHRKALSGAVFPSEGRKTGLWDLGTRKAIWTWEGKEGWGGPLAFSPDGTLILISKTTNAGTDKQRGHFVLFDAMTGKLVSKLEGMGSSPAFLPGGNQVMAHSGDAVRVWDVRTGKEVRALSVYPGERMSWQRRPTKEEVEAFVFSADGRSAALVTGNNGLSREDTLTVKVWDISGKHSKLINSWHDPTAP
jgi:WD40 repeat protein